MRRVALILATVGILCLAAGQAQAHPYHHSYSGFYHGYYGPVVVRPSVWVAPPVVVPVPAYPPVYQPPCYYPTPAAAVYYRGPGLSIGVGF